MRIASIFTVLFLTICLTAIPVFVLAGENPAAEACRKAAANLEQEKGAEAIDLIRTALQEAWQQSPLSLRNPTLITEPPQGYGLFSPRESNRYSSAETIQLYLEPVGYTVKAEEGLYTFGMTSDFNLLDEKGAALGGQREFGKWVCASHRFNTEFMLHFNFNFPGLPAGKYTLELIINDMFGKKSATLKQALVIE